VLVQVAGTSRAMTMRAARLHGSSQGRIALDSHRAARRRVIGRRLVFATPRVIAVSQRDRVGLKAVAPEPLPERAIPARGWRSPRRLDAPPALGKKPTEQGSTTPQAGSEVNILFTSEH
jgi:hypothetical protein